MKFLVFGLTLLTLTGCKEVKAAENIGDAGDGDVQVIVDVKRGVTCYVYDGYKSGGIFCFTKEQLETK